MNASLIDERSSSEKACLALDQQYLTEPQTFELKRRLAAEKPSADDDRIEHEFA